MTNAALLLTESRDKSNLILGLGREGGATFSFLRTLFPQKLLGLADQAALGQLSASLRCPCSASPGERLPGKPPRLRCHYQVAGHPAYSATSPTSSKCREADLLADRTLLRQLSCHDCGGDWYEGQEHHRFAHPRCVAGGRP